MKSIDNRGFTMIELIAVIILMVVITTLVTPTFIKMSAQRKEDVYNNKIKYLATAAVTWGNEHLDTLSKTNCTCVSVNTLVVNGYATGDDRERVNVYDPRTGDSMNALNYCVTYDFQVDRVYADLLEDSSECVATY